MPLSAGMETALEAPAPLVVVALKIVLPSGTLRLLDGSGVLTIDGEDYAGGDPTLGVLAGIEPITDGIAAEAPALRIVINPPTNTASADLAAADAQGSPVTLMILALDPVTHAIQGDPFVAFLGEVDVPTLDVDKSFRTVTLDCVSAWEKFFEDDEGVRLTDNWHQSIWPGETGLAYVIEVTRQLPWGQDSPVPAVVTQNKTTQVGQPVISIGGAFNPGSFFL
jgi:hypothetical protein